MDEKSTENEPVETTTAHAQNLYWTSTFCAIFMVVVGVAASELRCAMKNARMKSGCFPGNVLDRLQKDEFEVRVEVYRGF